MNSILLKQFSDFLADTIGLYFDKDKWDNMTKGVELASKDFGFTSAEECIGNLMKGTLSRRKAEILASYLTIGETYFFRDKPIFNILEQYIFPRLIKVKKDSNKKIRIWSSACSSGEEPYSIAMSANKLAENLKDFDVFIKATDINVNSIKKAESGVYSKWSFRENENLLTSSYFSKIGNNSFIINDKIKNSVNFNYLNLACDCFPSISNNTNAMDVVFCRNVLMYFSIDKAKKVITDLSKCIVPGGYLILAPTDTFHMQNFKDFSVHPKHSCIFKKSIDINYKTQVLGNNEIENYFYSTTTKASSPTLIEDWLLPESKCTKSTFIEKKETAEELIISGKYSDAISVLLSSIEIVKNSSSSEKLQKLYLKISECYANIGNLDKAEIWCKKSIELNKLHAYSYYLLAIIFQEKNDSHNAIKTLKKSIYINNEFIPSIYALANIMKGEGKMLEAIKYYKNALSLLMLKDENDILIKEEGITVKRLKYIIDIVLNGESI